MSFEAGSKLGAYTITEAIGRGGMGEVWRAHDTKLGRDVAIKTLPAEFASDPERLARFEREARLLASLNHPNIAAIYGLEEDEGTRFLVLELVEGETLADRVRRGAIPVQESLALALQVAEALEAAHEKGVIHRDLKPANIKVTPEGIVKVLDFGLAKALMGDMPEVNAANSPTLSMQATRQGIILGTAAYMAPEQARGREVDKRADIWAFGCVLFEMLTGRQAFAADDVSLTLARVLERAPEFDSLPAQLHPRLRDVLERCLEKEPKARWQAIGDVRVEIERVQAAPAEDWTSPRAGAASTAKVLLAVATAILVTGISVWFLKPAPASEAPALTRFNHFIPEGQRFTLPFRPVVALSPDGGNLIYVANNQLYLRPMAELEARPVPGTDENPVQPFFSPDGEWIGYWSTPDFRLKKISIRGGAPVALATTGSPPFGASWSPDGTILYGQTEGIMRVSENGGSPQLLVAAGEGEVLYGPQRLPDGETMLFTLTRQDAAGTEVEIVAESTDSEERRTIWPGGSDARFLPSGHLLYFSEGVLFSIGFDPDSMEVTGGPIPVAESVRPTITTGAAHYAVSTNGVLAYAGGVGDVNYELVWFDQTGDRLEAIGQPAPYFQITLSPDGRFVAAAINSETGSDIWTLDLTRGGIASRLTFNPADDVDPVWSPDSRSVAYASQRGAQWVLYEKAVGSGPGEDETLWESDGVIYPDSWSSDGWIAYHTQSGPIWLVPVSGEGEAYPFIDDTIPKDEPHLSPDGAWMTYTSSQTGQWEVFLRAVSPPGPATRISDDAGGGQPKWRSDGNAIYYTDFDSNLKVVETPLVDGVREPGTPRTLFRMPIADFNPGLDQFAVSPDGERVLVMTPADSEDGLPPASITVIQNWPALLD